MEFDLQSQIIERAEFLSPDIMPQKIVGRTDQIRKLRQCIRPMEKGNSAISAWLHGPPGTGKTAIARTIAEQVCKSQYRISLYVNCWERPTLYSVLQSLCEQLNVFNADSNDTKVKLTKLRQALKEKTALIILDELDHPMLKERGMIIYQLLQMPRIGIFCISPTSKAFCELDQRIRSKLSPAYIHFPKYTPSEVRDILNERIHDALAQDTYSDIVLQKVALLADGDARIALQVLLRAAINAEEEGAGEIGIEHISGDAATWRRLERDSKIDSLPKHQKIICGLIKKHGQISSKDLRQLYLQECSNRSIEPVVQRTFSKYLKLLSRNNFIIIESRAVGGPGSIIKMTD
jgi:cell division control protein 6